LGAQGDRRDSGVAAAPARRPARAAHLCARSHRSRRRTSRSPAPTMALAAVPSRAPRRRRPAGAAGPGAASAAAAAAAWAAAAAAAMTSALSVTESKGLAVSAKPYLRSSSALECSP
jgi:hypothetical protein